jgi:hypothetical protein
MPPRKLPFYLWLHPLLLALYPILSLYAHNASEVVLPEIVRPLCWSVGLLPVILAICFLLTRRQIAPALILTSLLYYLFFSYNLVEEYLTHFVYFIFTNIVLQQLDNPEIAKVIIFSFLLFMFAIFFLFIAHRIDSKNTNSLDSIWIPFNKLFLFFGGVLFVLITIDCVKNRTSIQNSLRAIQNPVGNLSPLPNKNVTTPDLYCIVLDAYARQDTLKDIFQVNNEPFLHALEAKGFHILRQSHANYIQTALCISALFQMEYLKEDKQQEGLISGIPRNAPLVQKLRERGYQFVGLPSDYPLVDPTFTDVSIIKKTVSTNSKTPFERLLLEKTPLILLLSNEKDAYDTHRDRILSNLTNLETAAQLPGAKFVFAHVLAPHPPFVLDTNGKSIYPPKPIYSLGDASDYLRKQTRESYLAGYAAQVQGLNQYVVQAVESIQKNNKRPYVIFIFGDHGSRIGTDWASLEKTDIHEGFANLQAIYIPEGQGATLSLPQDSTPLNTLRRILTTQMQIPLPPLEDKSFYSTLRYPYNFTRVYPK